MMMKKIVGMSCLLSLSSLALAEDLTGVWQLVSGEYVNGSGDLVDYQDHDLQSLKVISRSHFSFTSMKGTEFWASGAGTYEVADGKYTEKLQHNSFGEEAGTLYIFDTKIEGEYWYNSRWEDGKRVEYEVWKRVE
ncbi:hypothetical protein [Microbulbifer aggregans]|nr:hypothetical protein [Microbulbifer aggregans]